MHDLATVLSLGLTLVYLQYAYKILAEWWPSTEELVKTPTEWSSTHWLIFGIFTGFIAGFADNLVWGVIWTADYYNYTYAGAWMDAGVYPNVFFRQALGIVSAFAHIKAAIMWNNKSTQINHKAIWGSGLALTLLLLATNL